MLLQIFDRKEQKKLEILSKCRWWWWPWNFRLKLDLVSNVTRMIFDVFIIGAAQVPGSKVRISLQPQDSSKGDRTCIQQTDCATSPDALCVYNECTDNLCHSTEL